MIVALVHGLHTSFNVLIGAIIGQALLNGGSLPLGVVYLPVVLLVGWTAYLAFIFRSEAETSWVGQALWDFGSDLIGALFGGLVAASNILVFGNLIELLGLAIVVGILASGLSVERARKNDTNSGLVPCVL